MKRAFPIALAVALASAIVLVVVPRAQMQVVPVDELQGHVALGLALRHLANVGIVMEATAHPDDEDNGLLVMLNRGQGFRTALVTATRGNGGQNEIGPEIFEGLGVLRTEELAALHRFDGAEQYFTRAVDFGYSFSLEETFEKWGRDEITADYVRLIRSIRPDVIFGMTPVGNNGGLHHNASAVISHDASQFAADPAKYPEQIREGLRPWQPKKYYWSSGFGQPAETGGAKLCRINSSIYDELLGRTYSEIGTQARSMHKCQGMAQLLALPGPATRAYSLVESTISGQSRIATRSCSPTASIRLSPRSRSMPARVHRKISSTGSLRSPRRCARRSSGSTPEMTTGLSRRCWRASTPFAFCARSFEAMAIDEPGRFDIEFRLRQKEREFQQAIIIANGLRIDALSNDGVVVPGQDLRLSLIVANNGAGEVAIRQAKFSGFAGDGACTLNQVTGQQGFGGRRRTRASRGAAARARVVAQEGRRGPLRRDDEDSADGTRDRAVLAPQGRGRALHLRRRCAVRLAVQADGVLRRSHARISWRAGRIGRGRSVRRGARAVPVQRRHLQWREAVGAADCSRAVGARLARGRDHSGVVVASASCACRRGGTWRTRGTRGTTWSATRTAARGGGRRRHARTARHRRQRIAGSE